MIKYPSSSWWMRLFGRILLSLYLWEKIPRYAFNKGLSEFKYLSGRFGKRKTPTGSRNIILLLSARSLGTVPSGLFWLRC
jgi:hypothetical protein